MSNKHIFWLLFGLNLLNYIDRQVLYAVFPLLQVDLSLTDGQLGLLASVFILSYLSFAPLVGYFADRTSRPKWLGANALLWSAATFACGCVHHFGSLLAARVGVGMGEAGFTTVAQPFLAEKYPVQRRAVILALFGLGMPLGGALGYMLGGIIGMHWGWREAFMIVGIPGAIIGILVCSCVPEHRQTVTPQAAPKWKEYKELFKNRPFVWLCLAHAAITFIIGGLSAWMPTYLHRYFAFDVSKAGTVFGAVVVVCGALGTYAGGKLADYFGKTHPSGYFKVITAALLLFLIPALIGLQVSHAGWAIGCFACAIGCIFVPTGPVAAALVAFTPSNVRAMAFAVNIFIIHLLGDALSPWLIGSVSQGHSLRCALSLACLAAVAGLACLQAAERS